MSSGESSSKNKSKNKNKLSIKIQKKKVFRATEPLIAVFMWGVNYSCNELKHVNMPELLMPDDFKAYMKVKIDNQHFNKNTLPSHYKVKEYCPLVFKNMRERFSISDESYLKSLTNGDVEPIDCSSGKSNARFYISYDKRYIVKSVTSEDVEGLHNILTDYHKHIVETKGNTLLPHLLSLFRLTVEDKEIYLLVTRNVFSNRYKIQIKYDIKGSSVDRAASLKEKEKDSPTLKDNDLINDRRYINIGGESKKIFFAKLTRDVDFLCSLKIMDYSLLIGVTDLDKSLDLSTEAKLLEDKLESDQDNLSPTEDTEDTDDDQLNVSVPTPPDSPSSKLAYGLFGLPSQDFYNQKKGPKKEVYFMALIDILTHYGLKKRSANVAKTVKYGADQEISTVKPDQYAKRFLDFVNKIIQ
ncbi:phosphatidylinositol 5-phosphate 4-kinase type-2 alpha [Brachionus plicatilis]|uniref:1-phosphatidylinositol-5-phosphate 4-kinase n=1 Tax=Brachionus plicatilis TaxID=10195 RepID=A0A3M7T2E5_BRAPC|nr:phosphatidylinositol 5-phosphate 4-kinase type-2 alpha [Brachionus plicatilis]